ncbi:MAG: glycosyltransferase family 9 protein [Chitinophagaceae bacterium]|nr:glycosyltransferase family 9 protein [Bacteroidota bacterium]MCC6258141.1 glycosyltransferase family 9 protein [Chitinophagaceae bacterium]MCW5917367.1 glycosyltransferase family 9 protein [Ferruginibacter sp.]
MNNFVPVPGILIIQTAFIGDVVLATSLVEKIHSTHPAESIDFLVRKGNESLLANNPFIREVLIWDKKKDKNKNLISLVGKIRKKKYERVINVQRFFSTGLITALSGAKEKAGFDKNPLSIFFTRKIQHIINPFEPKHEIERNQLLIEDFTGKTVSMPRLYPSQTDFEFIRSYTNHPFITISPTSVWFTKQYPASKWIEFIQSIPANYYIMLLGGPDNTDACDHILREANRPEVQNLAGKLSFLQSAALMSKASMNYVNDSAPLHFCSAMNAPVTAIFCSTIPGFGYTPLSQESFIVETSEMLDCRPCGLHGRKTCPMGHFKCALTIKNEQLLATLPSYAISG